MRVFARCSWDDRCLHCNAPGVGEGDATPQLSRAAAYVSFTPKRLASEETLAIRRLMPERHLFTGHASRHVAGHRGGLRHRGTALDEVEGQPKWQPGDRDATGKYTIARPAKLNDYCREILG